MANKNSPELWKKYFLLPKNSGHKYDRGHAVICGGPIECTGASRLAALTSLRMGSGLVTLCCDNLSLPVYAGHLTSVMTKIVESEGLLSAFIAKKDSVLIGPGHGLTPRTQDYVLSILASKIPCVLDADALTVFENAPGQLTKKFHSNTVITPHEGEFSRIFPEIKGSREERALEVSNKYQCVTVLKGNETIISSPEGEIIINKSSSPWLATAGSGDVLSGIITSFLAQGIKPFSAACAAVWFHSKLADHAGAAIISEDLIHSIKPVLEDFYKTYKIS